MKYKYLSDKYKISEICFGCEPLGGYDWGKIEVPKIEEGIKRAIDLGLNFFDTADVYGLGLSEKRLSKILGQKRLDMVIATKGGISWKTNTKSGRVETKINGNSNYLRKAVEGSLKRLKLDILPLYYLHWPDPNTDIKKSFSFLRKLQREEKIDLIGCSNLSAKQIDEATKVADISVLQLPLNYLLGVPKEEIVRICKKKNIKLISYGSLAQGLMTGKYHENSSFDKNDRRSRLPLFKGKNYKLALKKVMKAKLEAQSEEMSLAQFALKWVLNQDEVISVISGIKNKEQIEENLFYSN